MIAYWINAHDKLTGALWEHISMVGITMVIAIALAGAIVVFFRRVGHGMDMITHVLSALYSIPSLALFAVLIPFSGLGRTTAVIVLVLYAQYILVRNFRMGLEEVEGSVLEAARAMGMNPSQIFWQVELPLASGSILAGIRLAATSTIGIATIASSINGGGLGRILFDGLRTLSLVKILWGTILAAALCILVNVALGLLEKRMNKRK